MPVETKETLEEIRNKLIAECHREPEAQRSGYVNGILAFYNTLKHQEDLESSKKEG